MLVAVSPDGLLLPLFDASLSSEANDLIGAAAASEARAQLARHDDRPVVVRFATEAERSQLLARINQASGMAPGKRRLRVMRHSEVA